MKATGIVRRIDDLGRVVIPKEIRRTMRIREGDPLEIYTDKDGEVIFKKYSPIGELSDFAIQYTDALSKTCGVPVIITDRDGVIAVAGIPKREVMEHRISGELERVMELRKIYAYKTGESPFSPLIGNEKLLALVASPIISEGDITGSVIMLMGDTSRAAIDSEIKLAQVASIFLGRQLEP